ncbi:MAG: DUF1223 domain-containing protein [Bradyrhizobiaceae bacterium]|nr:MAG: DUF1223 domain-containing protein [Bradyrhizobiaceae bacterium]
MRGLLAVATAVIAMMAATASSSAADPKAVIELFTSQGCSSCPPADKTLGELAKDSSLIALSLPIDYWDYLGWKDTLADSRFSARQKAYSAMRGDREVYTPQAVINGMVHVIGSDRAGIEAAVARTRADQSVMRVPVTLAKEGNHLNVSVAASSNHDHGEVWVCAISKSVPITIGRGENRGQQIVYHNVVRNMLKVADWDGKAGNWTVPLENISREGIDAAAVYVQDGSRDKPGPMLGAAYTSLN